MYYVPKWKTRNTFFIPSLTISLYLFFKSFFQHYIIYLKTDGITHISYRPSSTQLFRAWSINANYPQFYFFSCIGQNKIVSFFAFSGGKYKALSLGLSRKCDPYGFSWGWGQWLSMVVVGGGEAKGWSLDRSLRLSEDLRSWRAASLTPTSTKKKLSTGALDSISLFSLSSCNCQ